MAKRSKRFLINLACVVVEDVVAIVAAAADAVAAAGVEFAQEWDRRIMKFGGECNLQRLVEHDEDVEHLLRLPGLVIAERILFISDKRIFRTRASKHRGKVDGSQRKQ
jgi:hypothetical protein